MNYSDQIAVISRRQAALRKPKELELWALDDGPRLIKIAVEQQRIITEQQAEIARLRGEQGCDESN